ncbi:ornithine decarboxylase antizyme-domain-containing protein [Phyllosticta citriasiana]|uniref:Ornithine decarboxylase antizyme n=1 Tax=Phyllosticta citriasiana TaxID=595635 RepID=A0ABR1KGX0_9PEZI
MDKRTNPSLQSPPKQRRGTSSSSNSSNRGPAMKASCYSVDASSMALQGFHYSTTGAGGADPPLAAYRELSTTAKKLGSARRGGAACTIAEECERLFCETLRTIFLGEGNVGCQDSLATGMCNNDTDDEDITIIDDDYINYHHNHGNSKRIGTSCNNTSNSIGLPSPPDAPDVKGLNSANFCCGGSAIEQWIEVWDYVGGARFRGFVADNGEEKNMFVFFDAAAAVRDLKPGLMALIELCSLPEFDCARLNVCLDRAAPADDMKGLMKDLGWIGFEPVTLAEWTDKPPIVSDAWLFLGMEA